MFFKIFDRLIETHRDRESIVWIRERREEKGDRNKRKKKKEKEREYVAEKIYLSSLDLWQFLKFFCRGELLKTRVSEKSCLGQGQIFYNKIWE